MDAKFELVPVGLDDLLEKVKKAELMLSELKNIINEIKSCQITITLKQQ